MEVADCSVEEEEFNNILFNSENPELPSALLVGKMEPVDIEKALNQPERKTLIKDNILEQKSGND